MNEGLTKSYSNQFCATSYPFLYTGRNQDIMKSSKATCSFSSHIEHAFFLLLFKRLKITPTKYEGFTRENHFWVTTDFPVSQCDHDCPFLFGFICKFSDKYSGLKMEKWRLPSIKSSYPSLLECFLWVVGVAPCMSERLFSYTYRLLRQSELLGRIFCSSALTRS